MARYRILYAKHGDPLTEAGARELTTAKLVEAASA